MAMKDQRKLIRLMDFDRPGCRIHIRSNHPWFYSLVIMAVLWYAFDPNRISVVTMIGLVGILSASYFWARQMALHIESGRELRYAAYQVGDELEEEIRLKNDSILPVIWAQFVDHSNLPGYTVSAVHAAGSQSNNKWTARTVCSRRGLFKLGPWEVVIGEPFGLFQVHQEYGKSLEILVYPPLAEKLPEFNLRRGMRGDLRMMNHAINSETIQAFTTRKYQPGDPLRRVHWPTSAKRGELFIKSFDPETAQSIWLLPDLDAGVQAGDEKDNTVEFIAMLTATLASDLIKEKMSVGLVVMQKNLHFMAPGQGTQAFWHLMKAIAPLQAVTGSPLQKTLNQLSFASLKNGKLVVITPSFEPAWLGALFQLNRRLERNALDVILVDSNTFAGSSSQTPYQAEMVQEELRNHGVAVHVLGKTDIKPRLGAFGQLSRWEFITYGTGKIRVEKRPVPSILNGESL